MKTFTKTALIGFLLSTLTLPTYGQGQTDTKQKPSSQTQSTSSSTSNTADAKQPVLVLTTIEVPQSSGCWATIYDGLNFQGRSLTLMGANQLNNLLLSDGTNWEGQIDSLIVGPKAQLTLYGNENYKDTDHVFGANTKTADLEKLPIGDDIESLKIACK